MVSEFDVAGLIEYLKDLNPESQVIFNLSGNNLNVARIEENRKVWSTSSSDALPTVTFYFVNPYSTDMRYR